MRCLSHHWRTSLENAPHNLCALIEVVGTSSFPRMLLASVENMLEAPAGAVYESGSDGTRVVFGDFVAVRGAHERHMTEYAGRYASEDPARRAVMPGHVVTTCMERSELPDAGHRALLEEAGFNWRIVTSFPGSISLNVLHPAGCRVSDAMLARFSEAAPAYGSLIARHLSADLKARLSARCPSLTSREAQVCEGLLRGGSGKQVALALGLELSSVQTYRKRAYLKLGIDCLPALFQQIL